MLGELVPQLPGLIMGLADVVIDNAPAFIASGAELIVKMAVGLVQAIPKIVAKIPEIFAGIKNAFSGIDWASLGRDLINGIVNGLVSAASALYNSVRNIIRTAWYGGREEAEVGSPSKLFAYALGRWIPPGIAMGAEQNMAPLNRAMTGIIDTTLADMQRAMATPTQAADNSASIERGMAALASRPVQVGVTLDANARKMLRVIRTENYSETKRTSYNGLAAMA